MEANWRIVDERVSARKDPAKDQSLMHSFGHTIVVILKGDRRRREEEAGAEVDTLLGLDPPLYQEAWHWLKGWYWTSVDLSPSTARVTLKWITVERVDLHRYVPHPGANIPISVETLPVEDSVPLCRTRLIER